MPRFDLRTVATALGHASTVDWSVRLLGGFLSLLYASAKMNPAWSPQSVAMSGVAFFGGLLFMSLCSLAVQKSIKAANPTAARLEPHGGPRRATLAVFVDGVDDVFQASAQVVTTESRTPVLPPYVMQFEEAVGSYLERRIGGGSFAVIRVAGVDIETSEATIHLFGLNPGVPFSRRKHISPHGSEFADMAPVRLAVVLRGESGYRVAQDFMISWSGDTRVFKFVTLEKFREEADGATI